VAGRAHDIAVMYGGKLVEKAPTKQLFAEMKHPYTEALLESIPKLDHASHTRLAVIPGRPPNLIHPPAGCNFAPRCNYAQDRCLVEEPALTADTPGHEFACFYPVGSDEGREALAANVAAGKSAAGTPVSLPTRAHT
jgi:peptide/nickel transport system ATP-binding protein